MKGPISILVQYKNKGGFSLLEILVVVGLMAVITFGTIQLATVSIQSSQVVRGTFSEQELRIAVNNILTNDNHCKANLKPETGRLTGNDSQKGIGTISKLEQDGVALLEEGELFKGNLDIVKLELTGNASEDPKMATVNRKFVVYYSKKNMQDLNTLEGGACTSGDTSGCYFLECDLDYRLENVGVTPDVLTCDTLNCVGGDNISCYTVDLEEPSLTTSLDTYNVSVKKLSNLSKVGKGRALVGCGGTSKIQVSTMTAFGFESGLNTVTGSAPNQDGSFNTFMGYQAGYSNTIGSRNHFFGFQSGYSNTTGIKNIFIGESAGYSNTQAENNLFIGNRAGYHNTAGNENIFIGNEVGLSNEFGIRNVFIGYSAGRANTGDNTTPTAPLWKKPGSNNTFIGYHTGFNNTLGFNNTFIGPQAGKFVTTGHNNIFIGNMAGRDTTTGFFNTFIGIGAGMFNQTSIWNVFIGQSAGKYNQISNHNIYVGGRAGSFNEESYNTMVGSFAGGLYGTGHNNVFLGSMAGFCNSPTPFTHLWGSAAGEAERKTWSVNCTGDYNTFIGDMSGFYNTTGEQNVFVGAETGRSNTTGKYNVFIGGRSTGVSNTSGKYNTFIGHSAGSYNTIGEKNTFIGRETGNHSSGNRNIYIGDNVGPPGSGSRAGIIKTGSNQLNIGDLILGKINTAPSSSPSIPSSPGVVIHGTLESAQKLTVHTGGLEVSGGFICTGTGCPAPVIPSSREYKKNIKKFKNFERAYEDIKKTPLYTYEYKEDHPNKSRMGFISEELPNYLQIKDKDAPSMPDWPSIYGTFWAAIKALIIKFEGFKENTLLALNKLTEQIKAVASQIEDIKGIWAKEKEKLQEMIVQKIQSVDLKVQSQKKMSEENSTQLSHLGEKIGGAIKASENNQEEINKLNTLIRFQQKALTLQQRKITQLETKLKNIEEAQQKAKE